MEIAAYLSVVCGLLALYGFLANDEGMKIYGFLIAIFAISSFMTWNIVFENETVYLPIQESVIENTKVQYYTLNEKIIFLTPVYDANIAMVKITKHRPLSLKETQVEIIPKIKLL